MSRELTPERKAEIMRELAQRDADRLKEGLERIRDEGDVVFGRPRPLARLRGYLAATLANDLPFVLDPDYPEKLRTGQAQPLLAMQLRDQQMQLLAEGGDPTTVQEPPAFWLRLLELPPYVWGWHARDFESVLKSESAREQGAV